MNKNRKPNSKSKEVKRTRQGKSNRPETNFPDMPRNDFSWYNRYPNLTVATSSIPYPYKPGMSMDVWRGATSIYDTKPWLIPAVLNLRFLPSVGYSDSSTSPIANVAREMYARIRNTFSGTLQADPADIIMYMQALDSIFMGIAAVKAAYRAGNTWTYDNFAIPAALMNACLSSGSTDSTLVEDFKENKMKYWGQINQLILQSRKFFCPAVFDVFNRHYWLADNVFADSDTPKAQLYKFCPSGGYKLGIGDNGTELSISSLCNGCDTLGDLITNVQTLIAAVADDQDTYTIIGYLQAAYKDEATFFVEELGIDEKVVPIYNELVLAQIENAVISNPTQVSLKVTQDATTGKINCKPKSAINSNAYYNGYATLNQHIANPTIEDTVEASRFIAAITSSDNGDIIGGTELLTSMVIITADAETGTMERYSFSSNFVPTNDAVLATRASAQRAMIRLSNFDWHPIFYIAPAKDDSGSYETPLPYGDIENLTLVENGTLRRLHEAALYSLYAAYGK